MDNEQKLYDDNFATEGQLKRIADVLEEILQLVKADQERSKKYMEEKKDEVYIETLNGPELRDDGTNYK